MCEQTITTGKVITTLAGGNVPATLRPAFDGRHRHNTQVATLRRCSVIFVYGHGHPAVTIGRHRQITGRSLRQLEAISPPFDVIRHCHCRILLLHISVEVATPFATAYLPTGYPVNTGATMATDTPINTPRQPPHCHALLNSNAEQNEWSRQSNMVVLMNNRKHAVTFSSLRRMNPEIIIVMPPTHQWKAL